MICKSCKYWAGDRCIDPLEFVNEEGELCCRYQDGASLKQKEAEDD